MKFYDNLTMSKKALIFLSLSALIFSPIFSEQPMQLFQRPRSRLKLDAAQSCLYDQHLFLTSCCRPVAFWAILDHFGARFSTPILMLSASLGCLLLPSACALAFAPSRGLIGLGMQAF
ncbi:MAG: hypothetical protein R2865_05690 [Deinococcales bacterium]